MIQVAAATRCAFVFPAELPLAYAYYGDVARLLNYLPHISLVRAYGPDRFRLLYHTTELGTYQIRILADVQTTLEEGWVLGIRPLEGIPAARSSSGLRSTEAQGYFHSRSIFRDQGAETHIEYSLELQASLPTPLGLRAMPGSMVDRIARSITNMRIREIAEGFVSLSMTAFPHWLAELGNGAKRVKSGQF
jgi:hypothetical protein